MRNAFRPVAIKREFIEVLRLFKARNRRTFEVFQTLTTNPSVNTNGEVCLPQFLRRVIGIHVGRTVWRYRIVRL